MMTRYLTLTAGVGLAAILMAAGSPAAATVTFGSAKLYASTYSPPASQPENDDTKTAATLPSTSLSVNAVAFSDNFAHSIGTASFTNAAQGHLAFEDVTADATYNSFAKIAVASLTFSYTFTIDSSYLVGLTYDLGFDPGTEVTYAVTANGAVPVTHELLAGPTYIFSDPFGPGTYTLQIKGSARAEPTSADPSQHASILGDGVEFLLVPNGRPGEGSATPEPATWAMMLLGFGGVGAVVRRRRGQVATA